MSYERKRFTSIADIELLKEFDVLAKVTRLSKTVLIEEAIEDLLKKYEGKKELYEK